MQVSCIVIYVNQAHIIFFDLWTNSQFQSKTCSQSVKQQATMEAPNKWNGRTHLIYFHLLISLSVLILLKQSGLCYIYWYVKVTGKRPCLTKSLRQSKVRGIRATAATAVLKKNCEQTLLILLAQAIFGSLKLSFMQYLQYGWLNQLCSSRLMPSSSALRSGIGGTTYSYPIFNYIITGFYIHLLQEYIMDIKTIQLSPQIENTIQKHYASIIELKKNDMKINFVLELEETEQQQKQQLQQIKQKIQISLKQEQTALKEIQKQHNLYPLSQQLLAASDKQNLTKCFIKEDRKWRNAQVLQVDVQQQTAKIQRYGHPDIETFPAFYLKVLKLPDPALFTQGTHCKAIYSVDGQFYPCVIQKIDEQGYHVKYKKYNAKQVVKLLRLRPMQIKNQKQQQITFQNLNQFKVPQNLKILPNDPDNVKKSKKTKVKALKFAFKNAQEQEVNLQKKSKWKQFNSQTNKVGHFKTKFDMDVLENAKRQKH